MSTADFTKIKKISIITPCDPKRSQFLNEAKDSVDFVRANLPMGWEIEWIVCFDGPSDENFGDICLQLSQQSGVSAARNRCLKEATGDFILPLDADDTIKLDGVLGFIETISKTPSVSWVAPNRVDLATGNPTKHWHGERDWSAGEFFNSAGERPLPFHPNSVFVATELARKIGGWSTDYRFGEDFLFIAKISELGEGKSISNIIHGYRSWDGQTIACEEFKTGYEEISAKIIAEIENFRNNLTN